MSYLLFFFGCLLLHSVSASNNTTDAAASLEGWRSGKCSFKLQFCDSRSVCEDRAEGNLTYYRCFCPAGLQGDGYLDGTMCSQNFTQCARKQDCHQFGICNQTIGYCQCAEGFVGDGARKCDDINECLSSPCDAHATCANNPGSFTCTCNYFDQYFGDGFTCKHRCQGNQHCHPDGTCIKTRKECVCKPGFSGNGLDCTDIDECLDSSVCSGGGSTCVNEVGSYRCECSNGYLRNTDDMTCKAAPRDCEEIRVALNPSENGSYIIDPDFTGPAEQFTAWCDFRDGYAITELPILNKDFMQAATGDHLMDYGADNTALRALLNISYFCSQETHTLCYRGFSYNDGFRWLDAFNVPHTSWAGASEEGMCACGQLGKCERCYCDKNEKTRDRGLFVDKSRLPVTFVHLPTTGKGFFEVGPLRCGPRVFDIAADCNEWRRGDPKLENHPFHIDVDGPFGNPPFLVFCYMDTYPHVGVTEVQLTRTDITFQNHEEVALDYLQGVDNAQRLVDFSPFCLQEVNYFCQNSSITGMKAFVTVTSARRNLTHFPGANQIADTCPCGATKSCQDPTLRCNCDIEDGIMRRDVGSLINTDDLPVVGVTGNGGEGKFSRFTVSHLRCAPLQFGIEPNCEKLRSRKGFDYFNYTYYIDPDGPDVTNGAQGNVVPFLVECGFSENPAQGITIVHHNDEMTFPLTAFFNLSYLQASRLQIEALRGRSTYCLQTVDIGCKKFSLEYNGSQGFWSGLTGKQSTFERTLTSCRQGRCECQGGEQESHDQGLLDSIDLPITGVNFSGIIEQLTQFQQASANITIGPLKCSELFLTCASLKWFVDKRRALGETLPEEESPISIDPDGSGPISAFQVTCSWPDTVVKPAVTTGTLETQESNPTSQCFDVVYRDVNGNRITPEQLLALRDRSRNCFQSLEVNCMFAKVHHAVNYTTCDGVTQVGWAGSVGHDSCACGVGGLCQGGRSFKCNCDLEDGIPRKDGGVLIRPERLPVCQVCLSLEGVPPNGTSIIRNRRLWFSVSNLQCHPGRGRHVRSSCQLVRASTTGLTQEQTEIVYMNPRSPIPVGCRLIPYPPLGQLMVFPQEKVHRFQEEAVNISLRYYTVNITILHKIMIENVYCSQRVYFFCLSDDVNVTLGGTNVWLDVDGNMRKYWDVLMDEEIERSTVCQDYSEHCQRCGVPVGFVVYEKAYLPITGLRLNVSGNFTVVVDDVRCTDVFENCYEILVDGSQRRNRRGYYPIDPDGAGGVEPFVAHCNFEKRYHCAVTGATADSQFQRGIAARGMLTPGGHKRAVTYGNINAPQIAALTSVSQFCWQPVLFLCRTSKLINDGNPADSYYGFLSNSTSLSFGTGSETDVTGCACSVTGTCGGDYTCRCDASSTELSRDGGVVTDKDKLPITNVAIGGQGSQDAYAVMSVGNVYCSNTVCRQFPRDCQEAIEWRQRNGVRYDKSGDYFIQPSPGECEPFLVYCEMDTKNKIGTTHIASRTKEDTEVTPGETSEHGYYAPSLKQIQCLVGVSKYCIQPVAYECYRAKLLGGGVFWRGPERRRSWMWGGGALAAKTCACGEDQSCGGLDSRAGQLSRKCNCDTNDDRWSKDAGILKNKARLPVLTIDLTALNSDPQSRVNVTIGDLLCRQSPIEFDECATGFHDCAQQARCVDTETGYECICPVGWEGKTQDRLNNDTLPVANGRQCIDDDECSFNVCPAFTSTCINTPGSFRCSCNAGFRQTGPTTCEDIDECALETHNCDVNARCINEIGQYKCVCRREYRGSGVYGDCHKVGICNMFGDPHTQRFDGQWLHYMGNPGCRYVVTTNACQLGSKEDFRVLMKPWRQQPPQQGYEGATWLQNIEVHIKGRVIELLQDRVTIVDGIQTSGFSSPELVLFDNGRQTVLLSDDGIEIYWDGVDQLIVIVPADYSGQLCGLCGNLHGEPSTGFKIGPACNTSGNMTDNYQVFGNSWVDPASAANNSKCRARCDQPIPNPDCLIQRTVAEHYCDTVYDATKSPFAECLREMDQGRLEGLSESCEYDMCSVKDDILETICFHAEAVVEECQLTTGIVIADWRTPDFCGLNCSTNMTYMACGPDPTNPTHPQATCMDIRAPVPRMVPSLSGCVEGCFCKPGYVQEGSKCINVEECGCFYNGSYVPLGSTVTNPDCGHTVVCARNGVIEDTSLQCGQNASCRLENNVIGCHCDVGFVGDGFTCTPDPCYNVTCTGFTECVGGVCQCLPGYMGTCQKCDDIDECATQTHDCTKEGEFCVNTNGSFVCDCDVGYLNVGGACEDIDECALGLHDCPAHSQCFNRPGMYACMCCVGYSLSPHGECVLMHPRETQYIDPNLPTPCCSCNGPACDKPGRVCGSDGVTYPNLKALIVQSCLKDKRVEPMYNGPCKDSCKFVHCNRPYATCLMMGGKPTCVCPPCERQTPIEVTEAVCGSDLRLYRTECEFETLACVGDNTEITILSDLTPCIGTGEGVLTTTTGWSNCSSMCSEGMVYRTVTNIIPPFDEHNVTAACYGTCPDLATCDRMLCSGRGQKCFISDEGPLCLCPRCDFVTRRPICGQVGGVVATFDSFCALKAQACLQNEDYYFLDNVACEASPVSCKVTQNFQQQTDEDLCSNPEPFDYGRCAGGCGKLPEECCYKSNVTMKMADFRCPGSDTIITKQVEVITGCQCVPPDQLALLKGQ